MVSSMFTYTTTIFSLFFDVVSDPFQLEANVRVNARFIRLGAVKNTPRNDTNKRSLSIDNLHQGAAAISLAPIDSTSHVSGASHGFGDHLLIEIVGVLALVPLDERNGGCSEDGWGSAGIHLVGGLGVHLSPARDQCGGAGFVQSGGIRRDIIWQASRLNEVVELDGFPDFNESDVVAHLLFAVASPFWVNDDFLDLVAFHRGPRTREAVTADHDVVVHAAFARDDAVSRSDDPFGVDDGRAANVLLTAKHPVVVFKAHLIWVSALHSSDASYDPLLQLIKLLIVESFAALLRRSCRNQGGETQNNQAIHNQC